MSPINYGASLLNAFVSSDSHNDLLQIGRNPNIQKNIQSSFLNPVVPKSLLHIARILEYFVAILDDKIFIEIRFEYLVQIYVCFANQIVTRVWFTIVIL